MYRFLTWKRDVHVCPLNHTYTDLRNDIKIKCRMFSTHFIKETPGAKEDFEVSGCRFASVQSWIKRFYIDLNKVMEAVKSLLRTRSSSVMMMMVTALMRARPMMS